MNLDVIGSAMSLTSLGNSSFPYEKEIPVPSHPQAHWAQLSGLRLSKQMDSSHLHILPFPSLPASLRSGTLWACIKEIRKCKRTRNDPFSSLDRCINQGGLMWQAR